MANARRVRIAAQLLLAGGLIFVLLRLHSIWSDSHVSLARVHWLWLVGAFALTAVSVGASGFIWLAILRQLGVPTRPRWAGVFFQAQLGKYIPGGLWQYAGRSAMARTYGIPIRAVATSLPIELAATVCGGLAFSSLLLGWEGLLGVFVFLCVCLLADTATRSRRAVFRAGARASLLYGAAVWPLLGVGFWMTARGFVRAPVADLPAYAGAFSAAWVVGLIAIYAPGGLGVREAVLVALLRGKIGSADALVVALASRGLLTLADLAAAAAGFTALRRGRRSTSAGAADELGKTGKAGAE
jgi:uncharacterized membrane protein YbhN (UPF0104 family)